MPNLVSLPCPSLQMLDKTQTRVFRSSGFLVKPLLNKSCDNSRSSHDIDMKPEPVTKPDKRNTMTTSKKFDNDLELKN